MNAELLLKLNNGTYKAIDLGNIDLPTKDELDPMIGESFGKWTVIKRSPKNNGHLHYWCKCDCGMKQEKSGTELRNGKGQTCQSCGRD